MVAIAQSTFAVAAVAVLFGLLLLLLATTLVRARRSSAARAAGAAAPVAGRPAVAPTPRAPRPKTVLSRRDFFRGSLLASLGIFAAQFGGATIAFLWPNLKGGFGSTITLTDSPGTIMDQITSQRQPYYSGAGRFWLINYTGNGDKSGGIYDGLHVPRPVDQLEHEALLLGEREIGRHDLGAIDLEHDVERRDLFLDEAPLVHTPCPFE